MQCDECEVEFTKENAADARKAVEEIYRALPFSKQENFTGPMVEIEKFFDAATDAAPNKTVQPVSAA
jgi:hypothetical protein